MGIGCFVCFIAGFLYLGAKKLHMKKQYLIYVQIMFAAGILAILAGYISWTNQAEFLESKLKKNDFGTGISQKEVQVQVPELNTEIDYTLSIPENTLSQKELEELFEKEKQEVEKSFLNKNKSLDQVDKPVHLVTTTPDGLMQCNWVIEDEDNILHSDGTIDQKKVPVDGKMLLASVTMTYETLSCENQFYFNVKRKKLSSVEKIIEDINSKIEKEQGNNKILTLPKKAAGYDITWTTKKDFKAEIICALGVIACICIYMSEKEKKRKENEKRKKELIYSYAELLSKICLFISAGMTLRLTWEKIALTYQNQRKDNSVPRQIVYDEILLGYAKMQEGMSEVLVYESFAKNCSHPKYTKLVSLMNQNIKKGQDEFLQLLENEAKEAFTERKLLAKKLGEEASTKLLLPMMLMMGIVIAILIVPAIFSFQI